MTSQDSDDSSAEGRENWYTTSGAAKYLGVSEPTIFRWMKQGLLSFYKVGGSTRFSKDGMDALVEKRTGTKEAEAAAGRCAACGNSELIAGDVQSTGGLYFRPKKTKFWVIAEAMVPTEAKACPACGYIQLHADTEKLNRLRPDGDTRGSSKSS